MFGTRSLHKLIINSSGFTLLEVMIATSILTLASGMVGSTVFQVLNASRFWQGEIVSDKDLRHAGSWLAGDVLNSETTDLVDGAPPADSLTLTTFTGNVITYSLSGTNLVRTLDDGAVVTQNTLVTQVVSTSFSLLGDDLTFFLKVAVDQGGTETILLNTHLR